MRRPWPASPRRRPEPAPGGPLLDSALLRQLELLTLYPDGLDTIMSLLEGEHAGAMRAQFAEPDDHRSYQPGDDPRLIDWNAYARLDELLVRTSAAHDGVLLTLLVDCSRSMTVPGGGKLWHAKRLAAAFGAAALLHADAVRVWALADGSAWPLPVLSGRAAVGRLLGDLEWLPAGGVTELAAGLRACRLDAAGPSFTVLLTDLLAPAQDTAEAVDLLGPSGTVIHVTDTADAEPFSSGGPAGGEAELRDSETGEVITVTLTPALRRRYAENFEARCAELAGRCAVAGVGYVRAGTTTPVADLLFGRAAWGGAAGKAAS